jgi:DNA polymerase III delta prime subunit
MEGYVAFESVRGQPIAIRMLTQELAHDRLPQTLLFYGPEGSGKFLTALELVKYLNCPHAPIKKDTQGCSCSACVAVQNLISPNMLIISKANLKNTFKLWKRSGITEERIPDLIFDLKRALLTIMDEGRFEREYDELLEFIRRRDRIPEQFDDVMDTLLSVSTATEGSIIGIDRIRRVQHFLSLKSSEGGCRCVVIDGAERMNVEASNCFLKISEDTPAQAVIILLTSRRELIRETILSRCRSYRFLPLQEEIRREIEQERFGTLPDPERLPESSAQSYYRTVRNAGNSPIVLTRTIKEIAEKGDVVPFLDYSVHALRRILPELGDQSIDDVQDVESLLKKIDHTKSSIVKFHANVETALTDLLLGNYRKILRYIN